MDISWYIPRQRQRREDYHRYTDWFETYKHYNPHEVYIEKERVSAPLKREIRRWVEHNINNECFVHELDLSFKYLPKYKQALPEYQIRYEDWWKVSHIYWVFFFEEPSEAVNFKLRFSNEVVEFSPRPTELLDVPDEFVQTLDGCRRRPNPKDELLDIDE